jgi:hypothetical protein
VQGLIAVAGLAGGERQGASRGEDGGDVAVVEFGEPGRVTGSEHELHDLAEVMEVLPSVEEIDDLSGLGKVPGGEVPRNRARGPGTRRRPGGSG